MTATSRPTQPGATVRPRVPLWVAIAAGGAITAVSLGVRSTFGLLLEPIADGLDTRTGSIAVAIAIQNLLWGVSQPVAGAVSDRFGAARTLLGGGVLYMVATVVLANSTSPGMVLVSGGVLTGVAIGAASFAVVLSAVGRMSPPERRSLHLGIVSAVGSLGQFVLVPIVGWHLDRNDWNDTVLILAAICLLIALLAPLLSSRPIEPDDSGPSQTPGPEEAPRTLAQELRRAGHSRSYLMLNGAFFVCGFHVTFIGVFLPGYADDGGLSTATASTALALIGLFNVAGSLIVGVLGQHLRFTTVLAWIYGLRAVAIATYLVVPLSDASTIVFAMGMGLLWLATVPMTSAIVTQQFGPAHAGALFGVVFLSHQLGSFVGAFLGGELVDATGSYHTMWWISVGLGLVAMVLHLLIDEGPVNDPPVPGRAPLLPAGIGVIVTVAGLAAAWTPVAANTEPADSPTDRTADRSRLPGFCVLAPTVLDTDQWSPTETALPLPGPTDAEATPTDNRPTGRSAS